MAEGNWWADEVLLSHFAWNISSKNMSTPGFRGEHTSLAQRSGVIPTLNRTREVGEFGLDMWVIGCDATDGSIPATRTIRRQMFDINLNTLLRVFLQDQRLIRFKHENAAGTRVCDALLSESISVDTMMARPRGQFSATFMIPSVFWRDEVTTSTVSTANATLPKDLPLTHLNGGTAPIDDSVISVVGPITNPRVTDLETGIWVQYTGTLSASQTWTVDSGAFTSTVNGTSVRVQTTHGGHQRLFYIPARYGNTNTPTVRLTGSAGGTTTKLTVTSYRKYDLP
jgi:hypothetical protein